MFQVEVKPEVLKEIVTVISTLVAEAKFNISPTGIAVKAVDPAHVAMVDLTLNANAFESYKASEGVLGINIEKLKEVLKLARTGEPIFIRHDEEKNRLVLKVGNITRRMALVDTAGMTDPKVPNLNLPIKLTVGAGELEQGIKATESVSDHVSLIATPEEGFEMISEGDMEQARLNLRKDMLEEFECKEAARSLFSLDYFSNMIKAAGTSNKITMNLGTDFPVRLEFKIADGKGDVTYLLAPRIEDER
jgi:proliferating cell nuclear antigen